MLERGGADSILAVESNRHAFAKCLATAQVTGMTKARFVCGDFLELLREADETFDVCVACGVLYHLVNPVELISLLSRRARRLFIWTHVYDATLLSGSRRFKDPVQAEFNGFSHLLYPRPYNRFGLRLSRFPGGMNRSAAWLSRDDLLAALAHFGWTDVEVGLETHDEEPGPALCLTARNGSLG